MSARYVEDLAISFAMHCDEAGLTTSQADRLAEAIGAELENTAADRRDALRGYAPELIDDNLPDDEEGDDTWLGNE